MKRAIYTVLCGVLVFILGSILLSTSVSAELYDEQYNYNDYDNSLESYEVDNFSFDVGNETVASNEDNNIGFIFDPLPNSTSSETDENCSDDAINEEIADKANEVEAPTDIFDHDVESDKENSDSNTDDLKDTKKTDSEKNDSGSTVTTILGRIIFFVLGVFCGVLGWYVFLFVTNKEIYDRKKIKKITNMVLELKQYTEYSNNENTTEESE